MEFRWKRFADPEPEADLLGVIGELRPSRYRTIPRVLLMTRGIESQLAESDGLVGYGLRAELFDRRFWAVSAWEDEESLQDFVGSKPHVDTMADLKPRAETSRFETFDVKGEEVPIEIDEAVSRIQ